MLATLGEVSTCSLLFTFCVCVQFLAQAGQGLHPVSSICFGDQSEGHSLAKQSCGCTSWMVLHMHRGAAVSLCPCVGTLLLVTEEQRRKGLSRSGKEWARFT